MIGYDFDRSIKRQAVSSGIVANALDVETLVARSDVVILATPFHETEEALAAVGRYAQAGETIVTDTAGLKTPVIDWSMQHLPVGVDFVGGHPLVGTSLSLESISRSWEGDGTWCLVPGRGVRERSLGLVRDLVESLGFRPLILTADEHDAYVAGLHNLPRLVAAVLSDITAGSPGWADLAPFASVIARRLAPVAKDDPIELATMLHHNKAQVRTWVEKFIAELEGFLAEIDAADLTTLHTRLEEAVERCSKLAASQAEPTAPTDYDETPAYKAAFADAIIGEKLARALRRRSQ